MPPELDERSERDLTEAVAREVMGWNAWRETWDTGAYPPTSSIPHRLFAQVSLLERESGVPFPGTVVLAGTQ
jgi:hypothetical protein